MRKAYRYIALALALCVLLGAAGTVFAADYRTGALETVYDFAAMNSSQVREAFCADARGFLKALAFNTTEQQNKTVQNFLIGATERTRTVVREHLQRLKQSQDVYQMTQSERNLLAAMCYRLETSHAFTDAPTFGNMDVLVYSVAVEKDEEYARMLGGRAIVDRTYDFLIELSKLETDLQERVVQRIATFNGTLEGTKIVEHLRAFAHLSPDYEEDPNNPPPPDGLRSFTREQEDLRIALLEALTDSPQPPLPQEPLAEESTQWLEKKTLVKTDFDALMENPDNTNWSALMQGAILETGSFVKTLAYLDAEERETFTAAFLEQFDAEKDLEALLFNLCKYLNVSTPIVYRQQAVEELEYAILRQCALNPQIAVDFSCYIQTEENPSTFVFKDDTFWFCLDACVDPYGFVQMLSEMDTAEQENISQRIKYAGLDAYRQVILDGVFDLQSQYDLSDAQIKACSAFIASQGKNPSAMHPYGVDPNPTQPPVPTISATVPTAPLFITDPVIKPTEKPADPVDPTNDSTEPAEGEAQEEQPPRDTGWISTVCILLGLLCISIVVTTSLGKKKKAQPEPPDPEKPQPVEEPQPVVPQPVVTDPNAHCPATLDKEVQKQITQALREKYDEYSIRWYSKQNKNGSCRCYGTEGDCHIIFYAGGLRMEISDSCTVGAYTFRFGTSFELYVYRGGVLTDLRTALEQGLISEAAVKEAWKIHEAIC